MSKNENPSHEQVILKPSSFSENKACLFGTYTENPEIETGIETRPVATRKVEETGVIKAKSNMNAQISKTDDAKLPCNDTQNDDCLFIREKAAILKDQSITGRFWSPFRSGLEMGKATLP